MNALDVVGLLAIVGSTPPPEAPDEQLMNTVDDLSHMDEKTSNDVMYENLVDNLDNLGFKGDNPLDNW